MQDVVGLDVIDVGDEGMIVGPECQAITSRENSKGAEGFEAGGESGEFVPATDEVLVNGRAAAVGQSIEAGAGIAELGQTRQAEPIGEVVEVQRDFTGIGYAEFAGLAGGQGAVIGGQVGKRDIDLVANRRDDRQPRTRDGADHDLLVERPEVLEATAAARDHDHAGVRDPVGQLEGGDDLLVRARSLNARRGDQELGATPTTGRDLEQVSDRRPGGTGHDHDPARITRQGPLPTRLEQAFQRSLA